jgi:hypothetical protein
MPTKKGKAESGTDEVARAAEQIASRLRALHVPLSGKERPEELVLIEEAIEQFEEAVEARGGDLMVDEGPDGDASEPDDPHFALPLRKGNEPVARYVERISRATDSVRRHPGID